MSIEEQYMKIIPFFRVRVSVSHWTACVVCAELSVLGVSMCVATRETDDDVTNRAWGKSRSWKQEQGARTSSLCADIIRAQSLFVSTTRQQEPKRATKTLRTFLISAQWKLIDRSYRKEVGGWILLTLVYDRYLQNESHPHQPQLYFVFGAN